ncbi:phosphotransferase enzyme family protein [Segetibacter koreensis]|uniref:phosphotransferase enzyme family protein n=1 Tax=Segetibacter koreensis TaxID=398037 RepID=UPI00035E2756|nr:aminoglycoside phosphotransferase family protein [Segetibacter koreensis]
MLASILEIYGFKPEEWITEPFGTGLINHTWLLKKNDEQYILQRINNNVFKDPYAISNNIRLVGDYLQEHFPDYFFVTPIHSIDGREIVQNDDGYFRILPFVKNSVTYTTVESPELAFTAARQFGKFTHLLAEFDEKLLKETIPNFHNLSLRYRQFEESLQQGNKERLSIAANISKQLEKYRYIVDEFEQIKKSPQFRKRVMHCDTKISNVLFDKKNCGLCIIDLDTVMPGFFISDVGDMMRTYLCPVSEEEKDFSKIEVRDDYFVAIVEGYLAEMKSDLTEEEQKGFIYSGKFMIYMQCIRFLSDYFNNDVYYGAKYEGQNFNRAINQLNLLQRLEEKEESLLQRTKQHKYIFMSKK